MDNCRSNNQINTLFYQGNHILCKGWLYQLSLIETIISLQTSREAFNRIWIVESIEVCYGHVLSILEKVGMIMSLVEFAYNNSYHVSIKVVVFKHYMEEGIKRLYVVLGWKPGKSNNGVGYSLTNYW